MLHAADCYHVTAHSSNTERRMPRRPCPDSSIPVFEYQRNWSDYRDRRGEKRVDEISTSRAIYSDTGLLCFIWLSAADFVSVIRFCGGFCGVSAGVSAGGFCGTLFEAVPSDWTFLFLRGFCGVSAGPLLELRKISSILTFQILTNKKWRRQKFVSAVNFR